MSALASLLTTLLLATALAAADLPVIDLPAGWQPDPGGPLETTPTRERICLNGAWRFLPVGEGASAAVDPAAVRASGIFFQVPGNWPGKWPDGQALFRLGGAPAVLPERFVEAWYLRPLAVPAAWAGRRILLDLRYVQSLATVWIDGQPVGRLIFPGGRLDLSEHLRPGTTHELAILVAARRLGGSNLRYMAANEVVVESGTIKQRGLCGDAWLGSEPAAGALQRVQVATSVERHDVAVDAHLTLREPGTFSLRCTVLDGENPVLTFAGAPVALPAGAARLGAHSAWSDPRLWDLHTPGNRYRLRATLVDAAGGEVDRLFDQDFSFREFRVAGRELLLNGLPVRLRLMPLDAPGGHHAIGSFAWPSLDGMRSELRALKRLGVNCVYSHNYGFTPGDTVSYGDVLRACDEAGMLVVFAMPHAKDFTWDDAKPMADNGYEHLADWLVGEVANHPAVVMYALTHNYTGYDDDQNPRQVGGGFVPPLEKRQRNALAAEAIVNRLDPTRPSYHHSSGGIGSIYTLNCYLNWAPIQERADWFATWATTGVKPLLLVEWGGPLMSSWSSYRGGAIWSRPAFQQAWLPEYAAPYRGEAAYDPAPAEITCLRTEAAQFAALRPLTVGWLLDGCHAMPNVTEVTADFVRGVWPAMRTWGVSGTNLWWIRQTGWTPPAATEAAPVDPVAALAALATANRPGLHPCVPGLPRAMPDEASANALGRAFLACNQPCLVWLGGPTGDFTARAVNLRHDQALERQAVAVNDSRIPQQAVFTWRLVSGGTAGPSGSGSLTVAPGTSGTAQITLAAGSLPPGRHTLHLDASMDGLSFNDRAELTVFTAPPAEAGPAVLLYDPPGHTRATLARLGIPFAEVAEDARPGPDAVVVIGRQAVPAGRDLPLAARARRLLVFEQDEAVLIRRLGFRTQRLGLRALAVRAPGHPALGGLDEAQLHDWQGESTLLAPFTDNPLHTAYPQEAWNGYRNPRVWRAGNRGTVASLLIEKPTAAGWRALLDGGFDLHYAPLLAWEGDGRTAIFCQLDVSARSAADPAADQLCRALVAHLARWAPAQTHRLLSAAGPAADAYLGRLGFAPTPLAGATPVAGDVVLLGAGLDLRVADLHAAGATVLAVGCDAEAAAQLGIPATLRSGEYLGAAFTSHDPAFAGVNSALLHLRQPWSGALLADGHPLLGRASDGTVMLQVRPWDFDDPTAINLRRTRANLARLSARLLGNLGVAPASAPDPCAWLAAAPDAQEPPTDLGAVFNALWLSERLPEDQPGAGLLPECDLAGATPGTLPAGWSGAGTVVEADGLRCLRVANAKPGISLTMQRNLDLDPAWRVLRLEARVRASGVIPGSAGWHVPRIAATFLDATGKRLGDEAVDQRTDTGWIAVNRIWTVPTGAVRCLLRLGLFNALGTFDCTDLRLLPGAAPTRREHLLPMTWKGQPLHGQLAPAGWTAAGFDAGAWLDLRVPGAWEGQQESLRSYDGRLLYRVAFDAPDWAVAGGARLMLGAIDDEDETLVNGQLVGATGRRNDPRSYLLAREYALAPGLLRPAGNVLAVTVEDIQMGGGIFGYSGGLRCDLRQREALLRRTARDRALAGLYLDIPLQDDDPYRYYRW